MSAVDVSRLDPISLDELTTRAALQTRVDRKYVLPIDDARAVVARLDPATRVLEIGGERAASYESVYFDTPDLLSYRMAAHGRRRRFKLRTRSYLDSSAAFLEMKTRGARGTTVKDRVEYEMDRRASLTREGRDYADTALAAIGVTEPAGLALVPTLVTRYRRSTFLQPGSISTAISAPISAAISAPASRATLDTELSWEADDGRELRMPRLAIIETKSGSRASDVDRLLWSLGHRPATISKFGTGLAALRTDLPSTKWARVLRRHFTP